MPEPPMIVDFLQANSERLSALLPEYLKRQRWFGGKSRAIQSASPSPPMPIPGVDAVLMSVAIAYEDGSNDTYQLPLALRFAGPSDARDAAAVASFASDEQSAILYDATQSTDFRKALLHMAEESEAGDTESRVMSAEQSNTSIVYGDRAILKLYRRLEPGENPDVEISRFLTHEAHFTHIPAYLGQLQANDGSTLAFLQAFAANQGDGWEWLQTQLAGCLHAKAPSAAADLLAAIGLLGRRTAELHLALAIETNNSAFTPEQFTRSALADDSTRIRTQITTALEALKTSLTTVPSDLTEPVAQLLGKRKQLLEFADAIATASPYRCGQRIRVHGDYHLGQVLRTSDDFLIVDFEGEPARPLEERRRKQSPLRDVAGMLRSFSYAAATALKALAPAEQPAASGGLQSWERGATSAFLDSYCDAMQAVPELLPPTEHRYMLLKAFLIEKALYEMLYELNNRPSWLRIPLDGVLSLLREVA